MTHAMRGGYCQLWQWFNVLYFKQKPNSKARKVKQRFKSHSLGEIHPYINPLPSI